MIELRDDSLCFSFAQVHPEARLSIDFQRTLRIPDDESDYPLPPGLGRFPLRHVDDHAARIPPSWLQHGGVMLPMYQAEAMWICFDAPPVAEHWASYPFAVKVATGKVSAITGSAWREGLSRAPQDYVVIPEQPWLDGYCIEKGIIRQFVAMPLGAGYSAEEQLTQKAEVGGLQIAVHPMKREVFERRFPKGRRGVEHELSEIRLASLGAPDMGLAPGGRMRQEIYDDPFDLDDWDLGQSSRCFVHIANSVVWQAITGTHPPTTPPTAEEYTRAGLPWFDYFEDSTAVREGTERLKDLQSVAAIGKTRGERPLPENDPVEVKRMIQLRRRLTRHQVREGRF
jgi:hypothetical protein